LENYEAKFFRNRIVMVLGNQDELILNLKSIEKQEENDQKS